MELAESWSGTEQPQQLWGRDKVCYLHYLILGMLLAAQTDKILVRWHRIARKHRLEGDKNGVADRVISSYWGWEDMVLEPHTSRLRYHRLCTQPPLEPGLEKLDFHKFKTACWLSSLEAFQIKPWENGHHFLWVNPSTLYILSIYRVVFLHSLQMGMTFIT